MYNTSKLEGNIQFGRLRKLVKITERNVSQREEPKKNLVLSVLRYYTKFLPDLSPRQSLGTRPLTNDERETTATTYKE